MLSCEIFEIFKNIYFVEHLQTAPSDCSYKYYSRKNDKGLRKNELWDSNYNKKHGW